MNIDSPHNDWPLIDWPMIDWSVFERTQIALGRNFFRVFGYLKEDGERSILFIEKAIREMNAAQLVLPAHCIKGEALHFGAERLARLAARIEYNSRDCVELHQKPNDLIVDIAHLRPMFISTIEEIERAVSPLMVKRKLHVAA
jgi:hypothetical protein